MHISYDPEINVAYIRLAASAGKVESLRLSEDVVLDMGADGKIYGIELLNANEQLRRDGDGVLTVVNSLSGVSQKLPLL